MTLSDVTTLLRDPTLTWSRRRTELQGWRGADAAEADAAFAAQRVGPAVCAIGAAAGIALESPAVLAAFALTAVAGAVAANHPFEWAYNRVAAGRGRPTLPPNRAAKRLGCAIGAGLLGSAAIAYLLGATAAGVVLAAALGVTAAFVAVTGICIPSMLFTAMWGTERACARSLTPRPTAR